MSMVVVKAMIVAVTAYIITGIFGYVTFVNNPAALESENILEAPYNNNKAIAVGLVSQFFSILTSSPLSVLPCKDSIEELLSKRN